MVFAITGILALARIAYYVAWVAVGYLAWKRTKGRLFGRLMAVVLVIMIGAFGAGIVHTFTREIGSAIVQHYFPEYIVD